MDTVTTTDSGTAVREFVPDVDAFIASLSIDRTKFSVRLNRCAGTEGEQRDDIYYVWVGLQAVAPGDDAPEILEAVHDRWRDVGWTITRHRRLDNGGVTVAATDPETGNGYSLDSGFDEGPSSYIVGYFNTPCFQSPDGDIDFGGVDLGHVGVDLTG